MSTICLNKEAALQNGLTIDEVLLLLAIWNKTDLDKAKNSLIQKGFITTERDASYQPVGWKLTRIGAEALDAAIIDSEKQQEPPDRFFNLASQLKDLFPKGKKPGTNYYWAEGVALIVRRLKIFFKKYGTEFTDDQIIEATRKYVQGFNGDYQYMRLLKYFIFKEKVGVGGDVEGDSELISYIENAGQEDDLKQDWTSTIN